ncbi:integrase core domain-containing protein [Zoogloea sp.]|uniref:integrase core domain-containing protein n=1 Tax=Zoogloea sp. TaxID=49181 RepID=UPI0035B2C033
MWKTWRRHSNQRWGLLESFEGVIDFYAEESHRALQLRIASLFSRPRVSDDNAQAEAFFRTLTYCPGYPAKGFLELDAARQWVRKFVSWYNFEHCHSTIKFVTPAQEHGGEDVAVLLAGEGLYQQAKAAQRERWRGPTRGWSRPRVIWLNPAPDSPKETATAT